MTTLCPDRGRESRVLGRGQGFGRGQTGRPDGGVEAGDGSDHQRCQECGAEDLGPRPATSGAGSSPHAAVTTKSRTTVWRENTARGYDPAAATPLGSIVPMPVDIDIAKVARLARLQLTQQELEAYGSQLVIILEHAARVQSLETDGVAPTAHPLPMENALRADEVEPSLDHDEVMGQAPEAIDGYFAVPQILEADG